MIARGQSRLRAGREGSAVCLTSGLGIGAGERLGRGRSKLGRDAADDAHAPQVGHAVCIQDRKGERSRVGDLTDGLVNREVGPQLLPDALRRPRPDLPAGAEVVLDFVEGELGLPAFAVARDQFGGRPERARSTGVGPT